MAENGVSSGERTLFRTEPAAARQGSSVTLVNCFNCNVPQFCMRVYFVNLITIRKKTALHYDYSRLFCERSQPGKRDKL